MKTSDQLRPLTPTERNLIEISAGIFGFSTISIDDNFAKLGGDSLSAVLFRNEVHNRYNVEISIDRLFDEQATIAELAASIDETLRGGSQFSDTA